MTSSTPSPQESPSKNENGNKLLSTLFHSENVADSFTAIIAAVVTTFTAASAFRANFVVPITDPIRLKVEHLDIKATNESDSSASIPITITGRITNTSKSFTWLLKANWMLFGIPADSERDSGNEFRATKRVLRELDSAFREESGNYLPTVSITSVESNAYAYEFNRHIGNSGNTQFKKYFLGMGPLGADFEIQPGQEFRFKRVLFVPKKLRYQSIQARISIPILRKTQLLKGTGLVGRSGCVVDPDIDQGCELSFSKHTIDSKDSEKNNIILRNAVFKNYFCESMPYGSSNSHLSPLEVLSLYRLEPIRVIQKVTKSVKDKTTNQVTHTTTRKVLPNQRYCSDYMQGIPNDEQGRLGASILTVVHEEPVKYKENPVRSSKPVNSPR
jgi:hypothetical protein